MHKLVVANYKMNGSSKFYFDAMKKINKVRLKDTKIILCPPFVYLPNLKIKNKFVELGAQNIAIKETTKSTGQISAKMLNEFDVKYVIVGHSEQRAIIDNNEMIANKVKNAIEHNIVPIICVGEEKKNSKLDSVLEQVKSALTNAKKGDKIVFAYEPVWAIGSGETPTVKRINKVVEAIKSAVKERGIEPVCLYGGSVSVCNYQELNSSNVDGFLIGGTSLNVDNFIEIAKGVDND